MALTRSHARHGGIALLWLLAGSIIVLRQAMQFTTAGRGPMRHNSKSTTHSRNGVSRTRSKATADDGPVFPSFSLEKSSEEPSGSMVGGSVVVGVMSGFIGSTHLPLMPVLALAAGLAGVLGKEVSASWSAEQNWRQNASRSLASSKLISGLIGVLGLFAVVLQSGVLTDVAPGVSAGVLSAGADIYSAAGLAAGGVQAGPVGEFMQSGAVADFMQSGTQATTAAAEAATTAASGVGASFSSMTAESASFYSENTTLACTALSSFAAAAAFAAWKVFEKQQQQVETPAFSFPTIAMPTVELPKVPSFLGGEEPVPSPWKLPSMGLPEFPSSSSSMPSWTLAGSDQSWTPKGNATSPASQQQHQQQQEQAAWKPGQ